MRLFDVPFQRRRKRSPHLLQGSEGMPFCRSSCVFIERTTCFVVFQVTGNQTDKTKAILKCALKADRALFLRGGG